MRIRSVALAYMAGMGLIALSGSAVVAYKEWRHLATVDEAEALVRVIGSANRFIEAMALERGVYNQIVVSRDTAPEEKQRLIAERVAVTDGIFDETLTGLSHLQLADARGLSEPVAEARRIVTSARARTDAVWQGTSLESATGAAQALVSEFVRASGVLDQTLIRLERALSERDPRLGLMMSVSRLSNDLRDAAGQRSTILSRYAGTQQRIDVATASRISELTGAIKITWDRLQRVVRQVGQSPKVEAALARTRTSFMEEGERTYQSMASAAREGTPPVMEFLVWRAWTVRMLANTVVARDAPVEQALDDLSSLELAARARLAFAFGSAGGAALLILAISIYVQRRVVRPIMQLTAAIDGTLTTCQTPRLSPASSRWVQSA